MNTKSIAFWKGKKCMLKILISKAFCKKKKKKNLWRDVLTWHGPIPAMMSVSSERAKDTTEVLIGRQPTDLAACHSSTPDSPQTCLCLSHVLPILLHYLLIYKSITSFREPVAWNQIKRERKMEAVEVKSEQRPFSYCLNDAKKQDTFHG